VTFVVLNYQDMSIR